MACFHCTFQVQKHCYNLAVMFWTCNYNCKPKIHILQNKMIWRMPEHALTHKYLSLKKNLLWVTSQTISMIEWALKQHLEWMGEVTFYCNYVNTLAHIGIWGGHQHGQLWEPSLKGQFPILHTYNSAPQSKNAVSTF